MPEHIRQDLRDSYACTCGPRTVKAGRLTRGRLDDDPGEKNLRLAEHATGVRPATCPWRALADPYVGAVIRSHRWWKSGQLEAKWGGEIPESITWGVETFDAAIGAVQSTDMRLDREEAEARRKGPPSPPSQPNARLRKR